MITRLKSFAKNPDLTISGEQNFINLLVLLSDRQAKISVDTIDIGEPVAVNDSEFSYNTEVELTSKPGANFCGKTTFKYNRIDLRQYNKPEFVLDIPLLQFSEGRVTDTDLEAYICKHFGLLRTDVEMHFDQCEADGLGSCWIKAKRSSLMYYRSFTLNFRQYTPVKTQDMMVIHEYIPLPG